MSELNTFLKQQNPVDVFNSVITAASYGGLPAVKDLGVILGIRYWLVNKRSNRLSALFAKVRFSKDMDKFRSINWGCKNSGPSSFKAKQVTLGVSHVDPWGFHAGHLTTDSLVYLTARYGGMLLSTRVVLIRGVAAGWGAVAKGPIGWRAEYACAVGIDSIKTNKYLLKKIAKLHGTITVDLRDPLTYEA